NRAKGGLGRPQQFIFGARSVTAQDLFDLAPHRLDGIEVWRIRRQIERRAPTASRASRTPRILCVARLSRTTTSPGRRAGASPCLTRAKNISPFMGPSKSQGAQGPSRRMPAINVLVG